MEKILRLFKESSLYDACLQMLNHLQVSVNEVTREPISFVNLYQGAYSVTLPIALREAVDKLASTYYIGNIDEATLAGHGKGMSIDEVNAETQEGKYDGVCRRCKGRRGTYPTGEYHLDSWLQPNRFSSACHLVYPSR